MDGAIRQVIGDYEQEIRKRGGLPGAGGTPLGRGYRSERGPGDQKIPASRLGHVVSIIATLGFPNVTGDNEER
jgi:hypothetical protein